MFIAQTAVFVENPAIAATYLVTVPIPANAVVGSIIAVLDAGWTDTAGAGLSASFSPTAVVFPFGNGSVDVDLAAGGGICVPSEFSTATSFVVSSSVDRLLYIRVRKYNTGGTLNNNGGAGRTRVVVSYYISEANQLRFAERV